VLETRHVSDHQDLRMGRQAEVRLYADAARTVHVAPAVSARTLQNGEACTPAPRARWPRGSVRSVRPLRTMIASAECP